MRNSVLILAILAIASATTSFPLEVNAKQPPLGCNALPWETSQSEWDIGQKLPAFVDKQKLIEELRSGEKLFMPPKNFDENQKYKTGEAYIGLGVKSWPYQPGAYVAVLETEMRSPSTGGGYEAAYHSLYAAMLKQAGGSFSVIAKTSEPIKLPAGYIFNKFDFANYKLNETETAFGLQVCHIENFTGAGAPTESTAVLELIRNSGTKLERILSTPVLFEKEPAKHFDMATIKVADHSTNGFHDLVKIFRGKATTFQWHDGAYKTKDADAFASFVRKANSSN